MIKKKLVRIIPLGGAEEIGQSCTVLEQENDMIVIDAGISFPDEEMPGVDIVIPDFSYILKNKHRLKGIFLTHAHEDHIGALPYLLPQVDCPIYGTELTLAMVKNRLEEKMRHAKFSMNAIQSGDKIKVGSLEIEPIRVTHSIPENLAYAIRTHHGIVFFTSDFKFDFSPVDGKLTDVSRLARLSQEGVLVMLSDSTNAEIPGWCPSESVVREGLRKAFMEANGRVLITTFASNIHRMQQVFDAAAESGRKVAVAGRRMDQNLETCRKLGFIQYPDETKITLDKAKKLYPDEVVILTTGSQGEPMSALVQMSKKSYSRLHIEKGDTILYSARPIPGNEAAIWKTVNRLFEMGAKVIYESSTPIHVSGHGYREELKMMINLLQPYYLAPIHGEHRHQFAYLDLAKSMGYSSERLFELADGMPLCLSEKEAWIDPCVEHGKIFIDSSRTQGVSQEILDERTLLSREGILTICLSLDKQNSEILEKPKFLAKGFSCTAELLEAMTSFLSECLKQKDIQDLQNREEIEKVLEKKLGKLILKKTQLKPIILIVIHSV